MSTAKELIARSITYNEIAHGTYDEETAWDLEAWSEESVENGDTAEYWGVDDDGAEWRVHLDR